MSQTATTNRDIISASIDIDATPAAVWSIVSDLKRMGEWSPQCRRMFVRGSGPVGLGTKTVNINRRGLLFWPTQTMVKTFEPARQLSFKVRENGTIWSYELAPNGSGGTRLTESRLAPNGVSSLSNFLTRTLLGGTAKFEAELELGIKQTLARIKREAEATR